MGGVNSLVLCRGSALRSEEFGQDRRRPGPMHISQKELQSGAAVVFRIPRIHHGFGEIRTRAFQTSGHDLSCVRAFSLTCDDDDDTDGDDGVCGVAGTCVSSFFFVSARCRPTRQSPPLSQVSANH